MGRGDLLGGICLVVHEEHINIRGVLDKECFVAGRHHVLSLAIGSVSDLIFRDRFPVRIPFPYSPKFNSTPYCRLDESYRRHGSLSLKPPPDPVVNTLRLPP